MGDDSPCASRIKAGLNRGPKNPADEKQGTGNRMRYRQGRRSPLLEVFLPSHIFLTDFRDAQLDSNLALLRRFGRVRQIVAKAAQRRSLFLIWLGAPATLTGLAIPSEW